MSITTIHPTLTWKQADDHVHVATRDGEFAGFVEFDGTAHLVHDHHGTELGAHPTLADARRVLEDAVRGGRRPLRFAPRRSRSRARA